MSAVIVSEKSGNSKIGQVSATYAAQQTCPSTCPLKGSGCYAEGGMVGMHTRKLNASSEANSATLEELAEMEATGIRKLSGKYPLRLHVVGDATTNQAATILSLASGEHTAKSNQPVWSYTHAWRNVSRSSWGNVSILASCETVSDAKLAMAKGYAAAVVVSEHASDKAYMVDGVRLIPCPQQTGRAENCVKCGLCMKAPILKASGSVIAFAIHGQQVKKAASMLVQIGRA
jgi:hypothetical protein